MQIKQFHVKGLTCQSCCTRLEKQLNSNPKIELASVNFANEQLSVTSELTDQQIVDLVKKIGFSASKVVDKNESFQSKNNIFRWIVSIALIVIFGTQMLLMNFAKRGFSDDYLLIFAVFGQIYLGSKFYLTAWQKLKSKSLTMDTLIVLSTTTTFVYSLVVYFGNLGLETYFDAGAMVLSFVSLGKLIESKTKRKAFSDMADLYQLIPQKVIKYQDDKQVEISVDQLMIDDILMVKQGDKIAGDGVLLQGFIECDESHLTGEAILIGKNKNDNLFAGAKVLSGSGIYQIKRLGKATFLGDMINALNIAQTTKAPIARIADKLASIFVPTILILAVIVFIGVYWFSGNATTAIMRTVALLLVACPCAMGLATPTAIVVGMNSAIKKGIWFRDAQSLENSANVDLVALDKTGTITKGSVDLVDTIIFDNDFSENLAKQLTATVEQYANHPFAKVFLKEFKDNLLASEKGENFAGLGAMAHIDGFGMVKAGNAKFIKLDKIPEKITNNQIWQTGSWVFLSVEEKLVAGFLLADNLKEDSQLAIKQLQKQSVKVMILSGDRQETVDYYGQKVNSDINLGNLSPQEKANQIKKQQELGKKVAFVGDGVNDALALTVADVSFAMKSGADIAQNQAMVVLIRSNISQMVDAIYLAQKTLSAIKQNLFFAFVYNVLAIPLAIFGFLNPVVAGLAMALSSLSVMANALRLRQKLKKGIYELPTNSIADTK